MEIASTAAGASGTLGGVSSGASSRVNTQDFLQLLTTQLANQNPLEPIGDTEFMAQLAQLSAVEQAENQSSLLEQILSGIQATNVLSGLGNASSLIDRTISYFDGNAIAEGRVGGVSFADGQIRLEVGNKLVPLGNVVSVVSGGGATGTPAAGESADEVAGEAAEEAGDATDEVASTPPATGSTTPPPSSSASTEVDDELTDDASGSSGPDPDDAIDA
ncbi:MAG: flagellar hook capping FlgD N-terminal domain-containing protein [Planctomycetota bacterium]